MSTSDVPSTQVKERSGYCRELRYALDIIRNAETDYIEPSVCEKANVLRQPLSLDDRSDCRPCFFDRYRGGLDDLTNPEWDDPDFYEPHLKNYQNVQGVHNFIISYFGHYPPMEAPGSFTASYALLVYSRWFLF
ncbi:uncharacterized protein N7459_006470 [Penicillium hispanicum]|uniref:uncharacterized protein n=1 Tax=Penicillium hispanicum TaxID=1080232 RepID=UPI002541BCA3|nr:uncharacterized protein N7459_006470 [Penicillium hispanicum]KAJ5577506.1 hypothetical protein N7459_006470 [Penicillium hispanicum]